MFALTRGLLLLLLRRRAPFRTRLLLRPGFGLTIALRVRALAPAIAALALPLAIAAAALTFAAAASVVIAAAVAALVARASVFALGVGGGSRHGRGAQSG